MALRYVGLAGAGWILDMILFSALVSAGAEPGIANVISATVAAMSVFAVSRKLLFRVEGASTRDLVAYFSYTEANIVLWALAIQLLTAAILRGGLIGDEATAAVTAKILVTPLSLASNFLVTRWLSRRPQDER